ncbi:unnamed protein product [Amoebophrya sp. A25]|nr:unnamed protein product [Amoebophrya sp. A25]|eukprot:GSA25T00010828001.1
MLMMKMMLMMMIANMVPLRPRKIHIKRKVDFKVYTTWLHIANTAVKSSLVKKTSPRSCHVPVIVVATLERGEDIEIREKDSTKNTNTNCLDYLVFHLSFTFSYNSLISSRVHASKNRFIYHMIMMSVSVYKLGNYDFVVVVYDVLD